MAAITAWVAIWWLSEAVHLGVTSFLPFILIPSLGIADSKIIAAQYMDQTLFLFIGGFLLAFAIERWSLHRRIALGILSRLGKNPPTLLLGVMITTFLISMWVSNTATTLMLISAVLAVIYQAEQHTENQTERDRFAKVILLGLAYSASIGGMGTLVGTPPNMVFYRMYTDEFPGARDMDFISWSKVALPVSILLLGVTYLVLRFLFMRGLKEMKFDQHYFTRAYSTLGKLSFEEKIVSIVFGITAVLWFTRTDIDFGSFKFLGWENLFGKNASYVTDSTVAIVMSVILFLIPSGNKKGATILSWEEAKKLPFSIILLFGSGFALAKGFEISGLSNWLAGNLIFLKDANPIIIIGGICLFVCVISEFASNVASIQLALPILISLHKATDLHPLMLMVPATLAASLGFMMPVATAPNTIVFGSGRLRAKDMLRAGSVLDIAGILMITLFSALLGLISWK